MSRRDLRRFRDARTCFVCRAPIAERGGVYHADLGILAHQGACSERVHAERRVYDHSRRGRWRPWREVLARLEARRPDRSDHCPPGRRPLILVQTWSAPSGVTGDLVVEPHGDHVHVWSRWDQDWSVGLAGDEDWRHFTTCVRPVVREIVESFRCCSPLDAASAELLAT